MLHQQLFLRCVFRRDFPFKRQFICLRLPLWGNPFLHCCGWAVLAVPLPVHPVRLPISSQSLDAVPDQRGLVGNLPGAVSASAG